jgi:hypothetical protein
VEFEAVLERVEQVSVVRSNPTADADLIESDLVALREIQAWCHAQHAGLVERLQLVDSFPEQRIAKASKTSLGRAATTTERAATLGSTPSLADALGDGAITAEHVDAVTRASKQLNVAQRGELLARADGLVAVARAAVWRSSRAGWPWRPDDCRRVTGSTGWNANGATPEHGHGSTTTACGT